MPVAVLLLAESVRVVVPVLVRVVGLKVAVTPVGFPVVPKVTVELKPPDMVSVTVTVLLAPPRVTVTLVGDAESEKFLTVSVKVTVRIRLPLLPVTVMVLFPPGVAEVVVMVKVLVPDPETELGTNPAVAPEGSPLADKEVEPPRPEVAVTVTVRFPFWPAVTVRAPEEVVREKPSVTTRVAATDCDGQPLQLPVIVNG